MSPLDRLKKTVKDHLKRELDIMDCILKLTAKDTEEFYKWYMKHPYRKDIEEVVQVVRRGTNTKTRGHSANLVRCEREKEDH